MFNSSMWSVKSWCKQHGQQFKMIKEFQFFQLRVSLHIWSISSASRWNTRIKKQTRCWCTRYFSSTTFLKFKALNWLTDFWNLIQVNMTNLKSTISKKSRTIKLTLCWNWSKVSWKYWTCSKVEVQTTRWIKRSNKLEQNHRLREVKRDQRNARDKNCLKESLNAVRTMSRILLIISMSKVTKIY